YGGALSIEHEDSLLSVDEGFIRAEDFLKDVVIREQPGEAGWVWGRTTSKRQMPRRQCAYVRRYSHAGTIHSRRTGWIQVHGASAFQRLSPGSQLLSRRTDTRDDRYLGPQ